MFAASKTAVSGQKPDAQFNYVTMLLHGDGTNGAQNNTFLDSGPNTLTITRNGNTTQGSFSPYGSNWSNYFDGTGDYLNTANSSAFAFGTGDFTVECFINTGSNNVGLAEVDGGSTGYWMWHINNGTMSWQNTRGGANLFLITGAGAVCDSAWHHLAIVRSSSVTKAYWDGVEKASASDTTNYSGTAGNLNIAYETAAGKILNGYMSNFRIVKGTAVYTAAFTPPTTPLTAITNTSLLTCADNRFIDDSASPKTITVNGNTSVQRFNPFGTSTAYSTAVIGGSGYFDGAGDYLTGPTTDSAFDFGSGNWTIDTWAYPTAFSNQMAILISLDSLTSNSYAIGLLINTNGSVQVYQYGLASYFINSTSSTGVIKLNSWSHIVAVRSGSDFAIFVNGTRVASVSGVSGTQAANKTVNIGQDPYANNLRYTGYLSDLRVVKGAAVYDPTQTTITIPTSPLTAVSGTSMLTSMTNGAIFDNAMMNDLETVGNAQISTSVKKYGTGSLAFDGTGDALYSTSQSVIFGTGDFTLEFWVYFNAVNNSTVKFIYDMRNSGATSASFLAQEAGNTWTYWNGAGTSISSGFTSSTFTSSTWTHVAICRSSGTTRFFAGGTLTNSAADTSNYANSTLTFGARYSISDALNGYIDDLRITKGFARYTATFTPPTSALSDTGPY